MLPVIGITTFLECRPKKSYVSVSQHYVRSVEMAGGLPLLLPIPETEALAERYLEKIDGLVVTGGNEDVDPALYNEDPVAELTLFSQERDAFEMRLVRGAIERKIPILAICRGLQIMTVAMGGTLYQDVFSQHPGCLGHLPKDLPVDTLYHRVRLEPGSALARIFQTDMIRVNSFHHQAVKKNAPEFTATAFSTDGLIEAVEYQGDSSALGVQWHPEDLTVKHPQFLGLFIDLVEKAGKM